MTRRREGFLAAAVRLWLRLGMIAFIALFFVFLLPLPGILLGWSFYLNGADIAFELALFTVVMALLAVILGAIGAAAAAPFLFYRLLSVERATRAAAGLAAFAGLALALKALLEWAHAPDGVRLPIFFCVSVLFVSALCIPRRREQVVTSLDPYLGEKTTRRAAMGTGIAAVALAAAERAMAAATAPAVPRRSVPPAGPNILFITYDALSAEDMSLYGRPYPTTPHIEEFARRGTVFTNFYSACTFTTASIASILTGQYPSEHGVYHLQGRFRGDQSTFTLPHLLRTAGYATGASLSNPHAYFLAQGIAGEFDLLPKPVYRAGAFAGLWDAMQPLHQRQPLGCRIAEFAVFESLWDFVPSRLELLNPRRFGRGESYSPPAACFREGREMLRRMPAEGFFVWVHLDAPHTPYLPGAQNLGRFLPTDEMRTPSQQSRYPRFYPRYKPSGQPLIDKARLRYDEYIADADAAFGDFISELERTGALRNTAVIVSADHGECFEGGLYTHDTRYQMRPEIHIPLVVRMPGQERGSRVAVTADQTSLAPTILEIAGLTRGDWMRAPSLMPWLMPWLNPERTRGNTGAGEGVAFTQYLSTNSAFKPVTHGTVGVIGGAHQYVLDLDSGKGSLRNLTDAPAWNADRSAENPAASQTLRSAIYARFPELPR